jgi:hypothetical protein
MVDVAEVGDLGGCDRRVEIESFETFAAFARHQSVEQKVTEATKDSP